MLSKENRVTCAGILSNLAIELPGLKADGAPFGGGSVYFDWVRVRPYVEVEPQIMQPDFKDTGANRGGR